MDFATLPPEINSLRMYTGPGSGPMLAAAAAWDRVAAELQTASASYQSAVTQLAAETWLGPAATAMTGAVTPYIAWLSAIGMQAETVANQVRTVASAYESAFGMTVPPSVVAANRTQLLLLVATNVLGQNAAAIAANEAAYGEMWAQDAAAMYGYAGSSLPAAELTPFVPPPRATDPAGQGNQAAAAGHNAANIAAQQALSQLTPGSNTTPMSAASTPGAAPAPPPPPTPAPAPALPDLLGLNALSAAGLAASAVGIGISAGAWVAADGATEEILNAQDQLYITEYQILENIDLFSPLTPSRPVGAEVFIPGHISNLPPVSTTAAFGEAVSAGRLSVPLSWAQAAPQLQSLSYSMPNRPDPGAVPPVPGAGLGAMGAAFSQMAMAGMGGSALAGMVTRGQGSADAPGTPGQSADPNDGRPAAAGSPAAAATAGQPGQPGTTGDSPVRPDNPASGPVTGIAAEIREFAELRDKGLITEAEYTAQKQRLLGQ